MPASDFRSTAPGAGVALAQPEPIVSVLFAADYDIFPPSWQGGEIQASATAVDPALRERAAKRVLAAAKKYPAWLVLERLRTVYILGSLHLGGVPAGGTNSKDRLYLTLDSGTPDGLANVERLFHAEVSSILLREYGAVFPRAEWEACNDGFKYGDDGIEAVRRGTASKHYSIWLAAHGVLCPYSMSSLENDFNQIAAGLFMNGPVFRNWTAGYPRLKVKVDLAIGFYQRIDPRLNPEYFAALPEETHENVMIDLMP